MAHHSSAAARMAAPLLGHADFGTTERYYIRARQIESSRKVIAVLSAVPGWSSSRAPRIS